METKITQSEKVTILEVSGRLDSSNYEVLNAEVSELIDSGVKELIIDFSFLDYISSAGLRVILISMKKLSSINGKLRLCSMQSFIKEVFTLAGFSSILNIDDDLESSIEEIKRG